jgi:hypothetical protein
MSKKGYKVKPLAKDEEARKKEVDHLMGQFLELGISEDHPSTKAFQLITKGFIEHGWSASGILKFPEYSRDMHYVLSTQGHVTSTIMLRAC